MMPLGQSLFSLSSLLLLCSSSIAQPSADLNNRGIEYPSFRYLQWRFLDPADMVMIESMGYTQETWDKPGTDKFEAIGFEGLGLGQSTVEQLGFTEDVWDCYINHYLYYEWSDLNVTIQAHMTAIGWIEDSWSGSKPSSYNMNWDELTDEQRGNATEVCYFQEIWDGEKLQYWTTGPPTDPPTPAPTTSTSPTVVSSTVPTEEREMGSSAAAVQKSLPLLLPSALLMMIF